MQQLAIGRVQLKSMTNTLMNSSNGLNEYVSAAEIRINSKIPSILKNNGDNVKGQYHGTEKRSFTWHMQDEDPSWRRNECMTN